MRHVAWKSVCVRTMGARNSEWPFIATSIKSMIVTNAATSKSAMCHIINDIVENLGINLAPLGSVYNTPRVLPPTCKLVILAPPLPSHYFLSGKLITVPISRPVQLMI